MAKTGTPSTKEWTVEDQEAMVNAMRYRREQLMNEVSSFNLQLEINEARLEREQEALKRMKGQG